MESLTREAFEAARKLFEAPSSLELDNEPMFDVEDRLPEISCEYLTRWQGFRVWMRFDVKASAWFVHGFKQQQAFPSHWLEGGRQALPVGDIRRPERAPTC